MKSNALKLISGLYAIAFGIVGMIGPISYGPPPLVYVIQSVLIVLGVALLLPIKKPRRTILIVAVVIYSVITAIGLVIMFMIPLAGLLLVAIIVPPFATAIAALALINKKIR